MIDMSTAAEDIGSSCGNTGLCKQKVLAVEKIHLELGSNRLDFSQHSGPKLSGNGNLSDDKKEIILFANFEIIQSTFSINHPK